MARKKKDDILEQIAARARSWNRSRPKNKPWGVVMDCFDNLNYETKDGRKPLLLEKKVMDYGMYLRLHLPPGISYKQVAKDKDFFETATSLDWIQIGCSLGCSWPFAVPFVGWFVIRQDNDCGGLVFGLVERF